MKSGIQVKHRIDELTMSWPHFFCTTIGGEKLEFAPYDDKYAEKFLEFFSEDERENVKHFVTRGMSISLKKLKGKYGEDYKTSKEYKRAFEERNQKMVLKSINGYWLAILQEGAPIGYIDLHNIQGNAGELALLIGDKNMRGKGLAQIILKAFMDIVSSKTDINTYYAIVKEENILAQKVAEKVGFKQIDKFPEGYELGKGGKKVYIKLED